ncbi:MAG: oxidoreductase, partial [Bacteroidales bacterium]|nr:oxidoreductase [Bacteroidales bacterium]
ERFALKAIKRMVRGRKQYINGFINRLSIVVVSLLPTSVRMQIKHRLLDRGIKV